MFELVDLDKWPRKDHFLFYTQKLPCGFSVTSEIDITEFRREQKRRGLRFYAALIYCVTRCVNAIPEFRMRMSPEGELGIYDVIHPNYTVFHEDDHTFTDLWSPYQADFPACYQGICADMEQYGQVKGMKGKPDQPANFYCISCTPWLAFTGVSMIREGGMSMMPIVTCGKFREKHGRVKMPIALSISHAAADGYHASQLFEQIQEMMDHPADWMK